MARVRTRYSCTACGTVQPQWAGQCPECGAWNTLEAIAAEPRHGRGCRGAAPPARHPGRPEEAIRDLKQVAATGEARIHTGIDELDRVLGGGLVEGSVNLLGGDPGVGKSTLLLQCLAALAGHAPVLYVSGEESLHQLSLRAHRLGLQDAELRVVTETALERVLAVADRERPKVLVADSVQTLYSESVTATPGSVSQVREAAGRLVDFAKASGCAVFLVGHVTKEGQLAGPRVLEHMVDTVLYFEGDVGGRYRMVRAVKNRFGPVNELGVFAMTDRGLKEVANPSAIFLTGHAGPVPGSCVLVTREGTRPLLVEVQALVDDSHGVNPRRVSVGLDPNRTGMLLAVLHKHAGVATFGQDVFVNVVGGVRVGETAADLAVALAVVSSLRNRTLPEGLAAFGEVGLSGEIRPVPNGEERLREAAKQGFRHVVCPAGNAPKRRQGDGITVTTAARLDGVVRDVMA